ncbi:MAG: type VI secretion system tip protein TssI/VgrG [Pseudomonadota bacterium]
MSSTANYRVTCTLEGAEVMVVTCTVHEALSQPFEIELEVYEHCLAMNKVSHQKMLQGNACITLWQGDRVLRHLHGIVYRLEAGKVTKYHSFFQVGVTALLYQSSLNSDCRIFQQQTVDEILRTLLQANGIVHHQIRLREPRERREYCVQYNETDYDFFHRLIAEEGLFYWFDHHKNHHVLCIGEALPQLPRVKSDLIYREPNAQSTEPCVRSLRYQEQLVTARHRQRDYTFKNPRYSLEHNHLGLHLNHQSTQYERYSYNGRYKLDEQGKPFTQYRQEEAQNAQRVALMAGDDIGLCAAQRFTLRDHLTKAHNQAWYVIASHINFTQPQALGGELPIPAASTVALQNGPAAGTLHIENEAIPFTQAWRTPHRPKPVVDGPQMAHVVGPPGEEIYCDEWGRVKVQFPWDRYGKQNELSSCWIRVAQNWGGAGWGHMAIPRVGHEVIVDFLEGDPDQPIITGRTYHAVNVPPYPLPANKTRMTIKSRTHQGTGFNELRFEDDNGKQEIFIHAEKDQNNVVKNNETTEVGNDRTENIGNNEKITIGNNRTEKVGNNEDTTIGGNQIELIQLNQSETVLIAKALTVGAAYQVTVGAAKNESVGLSSSEQVGINKSTTVGKDYTIDTGKTFSLQAGKEIILQTGKSRLHMQADGTITLQGKELKFQASGNIQHKADKNIEHKAKKKVIIKGKKVLEN